MSSHPEEVTKRKTEWLIDYHDDNLRKGMSWNDFIEKMNENASRNGVNLRNLPNGYLARLYEEKYKK
jgi:hypothetical protein